MATSRARLGHLVLAAAYRPAGLTAKMISTLDVIAGGRAELGIGAGWKEDEWRAYGYGFPDAPERLAILSDHLEVISRMLAPGRDVRGALRARGGRGPRAHLGRRPDPGPYRRQRPKVTAPRRPFRRRAQPGRADARRGGPGVAGHRFALRGDRTGSVHPARVGPRVGPADAPAGAPRRERLRAYRDAGVARVMLQGFGAVSDPGLLDGIADDCAAVGLLVRMRPRRTLGPLLRRQH